LCSTEACRLEVTGIRIPWADALGWYESARTPDLTIHEAPFAAMFFPTLLVVLSSVEVGIAQGAMTYASKRTKESTRIRQLRREEARNPPIEAFDYRILDTYAALTAQICAAEAVTDRAGLEVKAVCTKHTTYGEVSVRDRDSVVLWATNANWSAMEASKRVRDELSAVTREVFMNETLFLHCYWRDAWLRTLYDTMPLRRQAYGIYFAADSN
jgi:hypothetical protein